jgi:hypothetical protein
VPASEDEGERDDRQVHQEDPAPADGLDEQAAQKRADHQAGGSGARQHADRPAAPLGRHDRGGVGQRQRLRERGPGTLGEPRDDQGELRRCDRTGEGADAEQGHTGQEQAPPTVEVGEPARPGHERREHQQVGPDRPLHLSRRAVEVALDRGQRDRHRGLVEEDQGVGRARSGERAALGRGEGGAPSWHDAHITISPSRPG